MIDQYSLIVDSDVRLTGVTVSIFLFPARYRLLQLQLTF